MITTYTFLMMSDIASGRVVHLQNHIKELNEAYEEYIDLLCDEINELHKTYRWNSNVFTYRTARKNIEDIKKKLK